MMLFHRYEAYSAFELTGVVMNEPKNAPAGHGRQNGLPGTLYEPQQ